MFVSFGFFGQQFPLLEILTVALLLQITDCADLDHDDFKQVQTVLELEFAQTTT